MIYQKSHLSKIAVILWMVALSHAEDCTPYTFNHKGEICAVGDTAPSSITDACNNHPTDFATLEYCTESICSDCDMVNSCYGNFSPTTFMTLTHTMASSGSIFISNPVTCIVDEEEYCYRSAGLTDQDDLFVSNYDISGTSTAETPLCCMVECDEMLTFKGQACGFSDGIFTKIYNNETDFCTDYCENRQLTYKSCGETGCEEKDGCANTIEACEASFNAAPPVCGSDFVLYSDVTSYCEAKVANTVTKYYTNFCEGGCTQANCDTIKCYLEDLAGYQGVGVCGNDGVFYFSNDLYCKAKTAANSTVTGYISCGDEPCNTQSECCEQYCENQNAADFKATCGSDYNYYATVSAYCIANCALPVGVSLIYNAMVPYTEDECSSLRCQFVDSRFDVCYKNAYSLLTNEEYCNDKYVTKNLTYLDANIETCTDSSGAQIDCTQPKCDFMACEASFAPGTTTVCGNDGLTSYHFYSSVTDYCTAEATNGALESFVCDPVDDCTTDLTCCTKHCKDNNSSYQKTCNTSFLVYDDVNSYCDAFCAGTPMAQTGTTTKVNFTENECKFEACKLTYLVKCNESFELVSETDYCNSVVAGTPYGTNDGHTLTGCGNADCADCRLLKCESQTSGLANEGLCLSTDTFGSFFYSNPADYCAKAVAKVALDNNDITVVGDYAISPASLCNDAECSEDKCCDLRCKATHASYKDSCDNTTFDFVDLDAFCLDFCKTEPQYVSLDDCGSGCVARDCQVKECENAIVLPLNQSFVCLAGDGFADYFFEDKKAYCGYLVDQESEYVLGEQANCTDKECSTDGECCSVRCLEQEYYDSCKTVTFEFIDHAEYCSNRCATDSDYTLEECMSTGDSPVPVDCLQTDCLNKKCIEETKLDEEKKYCLITDDFKGEYFESKALFCAARSGDSKTDFSLDNAADCAQETCNVDTCCEAVCQTQTGFVASCDPEDFSFIELASYCNKWCADSEYVPLPCEDGACTATKCKKMDCMNSLKNILTGGVCLATELSGEYFYDDVDLYCDALIAGSDTFPEPTTVNCAGDIACTSEENCYAAKCVQDTTGYITKCHPTEFTTLTLDAACRYKYANAGDDSELDICLDELEQPTACIDCKLFECIAANKEYSDDHTTVCLDTPIGTEDWFASVKEYCEAVIAAGKTDYAIANDSYVVCETTDCDDVTCCKAKCLESPLSGCKPDSYEYKDASAYCDDYCADIKYVPIECADCSQSDCNIMNCEEDLKAITGTICLSTEVGAAQNIFFEKLSDYCTAIKDTKKDAYTLSDYDCANGSCATEADCCERNCNNETGYLDQCDAKGTGIIEQAEYCKDTCKDHLMIPRDCLNDAGSAITCTNCAQVVCEYDTEQVYASQINADGSLKVEGICGNNDNLYDNIRSFCKAKVANGINIQMCTDGDNAEIVCQTDAQCCTANCLDDNSAFTPVCQDVVFEYITTAEVYCNNYCPGRDFRNYTKIPDTSNLERECKIQNCILNDKTYKAVCTIDTFELITLDEDCASQVDNTEYNTQDCGIENCTDDDCLLLQCELQSLGSYTSTKVCASNKTLYDTKNLYCVAKKANDALTTKTCSGAECTLKTCCEANCVANFANGSANFCATNFVKYETPQAFCAISCDESGVETLTALTCESGLCSYNECCNKECAESANAVCDPTLENNADVPVSAADYCSNKCEFDQLYIGKIKTCTGDCTSTQCTQYKCEHDTLADNGDGKVCASDFVLYDDNVTYCTAKYASENPTTFTYTKCDGVDGDIICPTPKDCCLEACGEKYASEFVSRCTSDYVWSENSDQYCAHLCDNMTLTDLLCETELCNKDECCEKECNADTDYVAVCDADYGYLTQAAYCNAKCNLKQTTFKSCDGECTDQTSCEEAKCNELLKAYATKTICLNSAVNNLDNYDLATYCAYQAANGKDYSETNFLQCNGSYCASPDECCTAQCKLEQGYLDTCHPSTYVVLDQDDSCAHNCNSSNISNQTDKCYKEGNQVSCTSCEEFKCEDATAANTGTICLTTKVNDSYFFANNVSYCAAKIAAGETDYALTAEDFTCTDTACDDAAKCCPLSCNNDTEVYAACLIEDYTLATKAQHCTGICAGNKANYQTCGDADCEINNCETLQCKSQNASFAAKKICFSDAEESNLNHVTYYNSLDAYCAAEIVTPSDNYAITNEVECLSGDPETAGPCDSEIDCCERYCLDNNNEYTSSCSDDYKVLDLNTYCTNFCAVYGDYHVRACEGADGNVPCDSCELFKCLDDLDYVENDPRTFCFDDVAAGFEYYGSVTDLCIEMIKEPAAEYAVIGNNTCAKTDGCETPEECCEDRCNAGSIEGACASEDFAYLNKAEYCTNKCGKTPIGVTTCDADGCNADDCEILKCEAAFAGYEADKTVCLQTAFNTKNLYNTVNELCQAKALADDTDYQENDFILCAGNYCTDEAHCDEALCLLNEEFTRCDHTTFELVTPAKYCENVHVTKVDTTYDICTGPDSADEDILPDQINCTSCTYFKCLSDNDSYKSDSYVCTTDGTSYAGLPAFCTKHETTSTLTAFKCANSPCDSDFECCFDHCVDANKDSYVPSCNTSDFIFNEVVEAYCIIYCINDRSYTQYSTNETECCTQGCITDGGAATVCELDSYTSVTLNTKCNDYCLDKSKQYKTCDTQPCDQTACDIQECKDVFLKDYNYTTVCGNNKQFYNTKKDFCTVQITDASLQALKCNGGSCDADTDCCEANCLLTQFGDYTGSVCSTNYTIFASPSAFCKESCKTNAVESLTLHLCKDGNGKDVPCDETQCCVDDCSDDNYEGKCDADYKYLEKSDYCNLKCASGVVKTCEGDACTNQDDCDKAKCKFKLADYATKGICLDKELNEVYHFTLDEYCDLEIAAQNDYTDTDFFKCGSDICDGENGCCNGLCNANETFLDGCDGTYTLVTKAIYCSDYKCGNENTDNIKQCTLNNLPVACTSCDYFRCLDDNDDKTSLICLVDTVDDLYSFDTVEDYCTSKVKVAPAEADYTIDPAAIVCSGEDCDVERECCISRCNADPLMVGKCDSSYGFYSIAQQCIDKCDKNTVTLNDCTDGCDEDKCAIKKCESENPTIDSSICTTDDVEGTKFFESLNAYCTAKVNANISDYPLTGQVTCANCNVDACCSSICQEKNITACNATNDTLVSLKDYCDDSCLTEPVLSLNKCYSKTNPAEQVNCDNCNIFKCKTNYAAATGSLTNDLCLTDELHGEYFFTDADEYCNLLETQNDTDVSIRALFTCADGTCDGEDECCIDRCATITYDTCTGAFELMTNVEFCTQHCGPNGDPSGNEACDGADCTVQDCKKKECVAAWGDYTGAVCLENALATLNFYSTVSAYCEAYKTKTDSDFETSNPTYCANDACDSISKCCQERCDSVNEFALCDPVSYDVITRSEFCTKDCATATTEIKCYNDKNEQIDCDPTECKRLRCEKAFTDASFSGSELCLRDAFGSKYLYTVGSYCKAQSLEEEKVTTVPTYQTCENEAGVAEPCADEADCCYASCIITYPFDGCDASDTLRTAEEICADKCSASPSYTIDYCPGGDCVACSTLACQNANPTYTTQSICIKSLAETDYYYDNIIAYCDAQLLIGSLDYDFGETILCEASACADKPACCDARCKAVPKLLTCKKTDFSLVTEDIRCNAFCPNQTLVDYYSCVDKDGAAIDCTQDLCNQQHACPYFFSQKSFTDKICIDNAGEYEYYADYNAYCDKNGAVVPTQLPTNFDCDAETPGDQICTSDIECCLNVCLTHQTKSGCDSGFNLITPDAYCAAKCSATGAPTLEYCGGSSCDSCELNKCLDAVKSFEPTTVCLKDGIGASETIYFDSKQHYCEAMIAASKSDYALDAAETVACEGGDCNQATCCSASCNANSYLDTCKSDDYSLVDKSRYCDDKCGSKSLTTVTCKDGTNNVVACTDLQCCADKIIKDHGIIAICGTDGDIYSTALDFCTAKAGTSLDAHYCSGECTPAACTENYCNTTTDVISDSFPVCGTDNIYYTQKTDFCAAYSEDTSLDAVDNCNGAACTETTCCNNGCDDTKQPVIYIIEGNAIGYDNACLGACAQKTASVAYTCDLNQDIQDCIDEHDLSCGGVCNTFNTSDKEYCIVDVGHFDAASYCANYLCPTGPNYTDEEVLVDCDKYDCSAQICSFSACLTKNNCPEDDTPFCAADGKVYKSECHATCASTTKASDCPATGDCAAQCMLDKCNADYANDAVAPVCASDGIVYDKANVAKCLKASNTISFACASDCKGQIRELRCKFDCQFNNA